MELGEITPAPVTSAAKTINLALQGGGAHGAFTWGVLDRLLEEDGITFEGISATSAGAANATVAAYGMAAGGRERRREVPTTARDIMNRINEISFNSSLMREMRAIAFVSRLIEDGKLCDAEMKRMRIHAIEAEDTMRCLSVSPSTYSKTM